MKGKNCLGNYSYVRCIINTFYKNKYMKTLMKPSALLLLASLGLTNLRAQSVDDIVSKHIDALGGAKVVSGVNSIVVESTVEFMGNEAPSTTYILNGKGFKSETEFNGAKIVNCVTDKGGWAINPMMGQAAPTPLPEDQLKVSRTQLQVGGPLFNYAAKGNKVELTGKDTADYILKLSSAGLNVTYYINAKTYLIDKSVNKLSVNGQEMEIATTYHDYKKTDQGFVMSYAQEVSYPQFALNLHHNKVEINKTIDPTIFEMPK
jgi:hypothetical protein